MFEIFLLCTVFWSIGFIMGLRKRKWQVKNLAKLAHDLEKVVEKSIRDGVIDEDEYREIREKSVALLEIIRPEK